MSDQPPDDKIIAAAKKLIETQGAKDALETAEDAIAEYTEKGDFEMVADWRRIANAIRKTGVASG